MALARELGLEARRIRRDIEKAVRSGSLPKLAGGGRRGVSVWLELDAVLSWGKIHYQGARMEQFEKRRAQLEAHGHTIWRSRAYQQVFAQHAQAIEDAGGTKAARAGKLRDLMVASGIVAEKPQD